MTEWHRLTPEETLEQIDSSLPGLGQEEAERRLSTHGPNELSRVTARNPWRILLEQFTSVLIVILLSWLPSCRRCSEITQNLSLFSP